MTTPGESHERELAAPQRGRVPSDTLANRLLLARKLAGLSIRDAADLCAPRAEELGVSLGRGAWTKWENGSRPLDYLEVTGIIAEKLDVDVQWLRFGGALEETIGRRVAKRVKKIGSPTGVRPFGPCGDRPKVRGDHRPSMSGQSGSGRRAVILSQTARS